MDLLILQNNEEIEIAKKELGGSFEKIKIIAWSPFVLDGLRNHGFTFTTCAEYLDDKFQPDIMISQYKQLKEWCEIIDRNVSQFVPEVASLRIRPFLNKLAPLRIVFFLYFLELDKLNILIKKTSPNKVYYFHYPKPQHSLLSRIMDVLPKNNTLGVSFVRLTPQCCFKSFFPIDGLVPDWFYRKGMLYKIAKFIIRKPGYKTFFSFISGIIGYSFLKNTNILVLHAGGEVGEILLRLKQQIPCNFIFWEDVHVRNDISIRIPTDEIVDKLRSDSHIHQCTTHLGIDLFDIFVPEIERTLIDDLPIFISTVKRFKILNKRFKFSLVLTAYEQTQVEAIFDQCDDLGMPSVLFAHGIGTGLLEGSPVAPLCMRGKGKTSKLYHFVYSKTMADYCDEFRKQFPDFMSRNVPVGSDYFENLIKKNKGMTCKIGDHIKICYVCSGVGAYNSVIKKGLYDDISLYELRYMVVDKLKDRSDITVYFKFGYNTEECGLEFEKNVIKGLWKNIKAIPSNKKFVDFMEVADLFIFESVSTAWFELLTTSKPAIFIIDPRAISLRKQEELLMQDRITIVRSMKEFELCIEDIIKNGKESSVFTRPNHSDKTFITRFATGGDFGSIERTTNFLKSLIKQRSNEIYRDDKQDASDEIILEESIHSS